MAKIILIGSAYPFRGGLAAFNERLIGEFIKQGHDASIITFSLQYPSFLFPGKTQFSTSPRPLNLKISEQLNSINPFNWIKLGLKIKKEKPDIIIFKYWLPFMSPAFGTLSRIIKKNKRTKIIAILDNLIPHEKRTGDKLLSKYFIKPMDGLIAMSDSVKSDLMKMDPAKLCVINPHPIFDNFGEPIEKNKAKQILNLEKQSNYLLFFGFIREYKGLKLLLEAFAKTEYKKLNLKLIVAGEYYSDPEPYRQLINDLKLNDYIIQFNEFIPDEMVHLYFSAADVVVQPYLNATQSGVTQIAFQMNKPMIVTNVGGLAELIENGKCGYIVEVDSQSIANAISLFFEKKNEIEFSNNVKTEKKKFQWSVLVHNILNLAE